MLRRTLSIALLVSFLISTGYSRIGETPEECAKRYGEPIDRQKNKEGFVAYRKSGLLILIKFWEGKAALIFFSKYARDSLNNAEKLSNAEIQTLLESNQGSSEWVRDERIEFMKVNWNRSDGSAVARYDSMKNFLSIAAAGYMKKFSEDTEAKEKKALDGF